MGSTGVNIPNERFVQIWFKHFDSEINVWLENKQEEKLASVLIKEDEDDSLNRKHAEALKQAVLEVVVKNPKQFFREFRKALREFSE